MTNNYLVRVVSIILSVNFGIHGIAIFSIMKNRLLKVEKPWWSNTSRYRLIIRQDMGSNIGRKCSFSKATGTWNYQQTWQTAGIFNFLLRCVGAGWRGALRVWRATSRSALGTSLHLMKNIESVSQLRIKITRFGANGIQ